MKTIGTTPYGGVIVEIAAADQQALVGLNLMLTTLIGELPGQTTPVPATPAVAPRKARKLSKPRAAPTPARHHSTAAEVAKMQEDGTRRCTHCGKVKPIADYYARHGRCKRCVLTLQKAAKLARAGKPAAKPAAADDNEPIHTDPADFRAKRIEAIRLAKSRIDGADRPVVNGRTLPVGVGD